MHSHLETEKSGNSSFSKVHRQKKKNLKKSSYNNVSNEVINVTNANPERQISLLLSQILHISSFVTWSPLED